MLSLCMFRKLEKGQEITFRGPVISLKERRRHFLFLLWNQREWGPLAATAYQEKSHVPSWSTKRYLAPLMPRIIYFSMEPSFLLLEIVHQDLGSSGVCVLVSLGCCDKLPQCVCVLVTQLCPTLCNPIDCSPPGSSVHGILQARILEWVTIPFSRGSSWHQGSSLGLLHYRLILYCLSHQRSPGKAAMTNYHRLSDKQQKFIFYSPGT